MAVKDLKLAVLRRYAAVARERASHTVRNKRPFGMSVSLEVVLELGGSVEGDGVLSSSDSEEQ